jgi:hypothetical protein
VIPSDDNFTEDLTLVRLTDMGQDRNMFCTGSERFQVKAVEVFEITDEIFVHINSIPAALNLAV